MLHGHSAHNRHSQGNSSIFASHKPSSLTSKKPSTPERGIFKGLCKTQSCSNKTAYYNSLTKSWYCEGCAIKLERAANTGGLSCFADLPSDKIN